MRTQLSAWLAFFFLFVATSFNTDDTYSSRLYKSNEKLIFSFMISGTKKFVSVCKDKGGKYIVYRMGTKENIELEYPATLDETSWNAFTFYYVGREGTVQNDAFQMLSFSFVNKGVKYDVYHNWRLSDASNDIGINMTGEGKETNMKADAKTLLGTMTNLRQEKNIHNSATGE